MPIKPVLQLQAGFTLIEVLVSLMIISVGLLGIAGLEALSMNNTSIARNRSLAAIQADGLASMMHANTGYWQSPANVVSATVTVTGGVLSDTTLNSQTQNCISGTCTSLQMAAYDLKDWGSSVAATLPSGTGSVSCVASNPVLCTIDIIWNETELSLNTATSGSAGVNQQTYQLAVQP